MKRGVVGREVARQYISRLVGMRVISGGKGASLRFNPPWDGVVEVCGLKGRLGQRLGKAAKGSFGLADCTSLTVRFWQSRWQNRVKWEGVRGGT